MENPRWLWWVRRWEVVVIRHVTWRWMAQANLTTISRILARTLQHQNHHGVSPTHPFAFREGTEAEQCPWGICDPESFVNDERSALALRQHQRRRCADSLDATDSRDEGPQLGEEALRTLQGTLTPNSNNWPSGPCPFAASGWHKGLSSGS